MVYLGIRVRRFEDEGLACWNVAGIREKGSDHPSILVMLKKLKDERGVSHYLLSKPYWNKPGVVDETIRHDLKTANTDLREFAGEAGNDLARHLGLPENSIVWEE